MEVSFIYSLMYGIVAVLTLLCCKYSEFILISVKTLPRDIRGIKAFLALQAVCIYTKLRNRAVFQVFDEVAKKYPKKICFYFEDEKWTFEQVQEYSFRIANYFMNEGYEKGDIIALIMDNRPDMVATWIGLSRSGVIPSLINTNLRQELLKHALEVLPHKGVIYEEAIAEALEEVIALGYKPKQLFCALMCQSRTDLNGFPTVDLENELKKVAHIFKPARIVQINFEDPLFYLFTSGTTGFPKAAIIKHSRFFIVGLSAIYAFGVKHSDIQYDPLPLYHITGGILGLGSALFNGTSIVLRKKFSASHFWEDCIKYDVTVAQYIGETLRYLYGQPSSEYDKKHRVRKFFGLGLGPLWNDFITRFGIQDVREFYGSTEGNCSLINLSNCPGSCGFIPVWAYYLMPYKLVKTTEDGEIVRDPKTGKVILCASNEPGELLGRIYSRDPMRNFEGYSDKASTEKKIVRDAFSEGDSYFRTGDQFIIDESGQIFFKDRCGDTFRWKGENVSTQQVEVVISKMCNLADVAVYGVKIPFTEGRAGMAAIADPDNSIDLKEFSLEICKKLPNYSRPLFVRIIERLDYTSTHKVKKAHLQKEGFDIKIIQDPVYFLASDNYIPLTEELFQFIMGGKARL